MYIASINRFDSMSIIMDMCETFVTADDMQSMMTTSAASDVGRSIELEGACKQLNSRVLAVEHSLQQQTAQQTRPILASKDARPGSSHPYDMLSVRHSSYRFDAFDPNQCGSK